MNIKIRPLGSYSLFSIGALCMLSLFLIVALAACSEDTPTDNKGSLGEYADCEMRTVEETLVLQGDREDSYTCVRIAGDLVFKTLERCREGAFYIRDESGDLYLRGELDTTRYAPDTAAVVENVVVGGDFYPNKDLCQQLFCECQQGLEFGAILEQ